MKTIMYYNTTTVKDEGFDCCHLRSNELKGVEVGACMPVCMCVHMCMEVERDVCW